VKKLIALILGFTLIISVILSGCSPKTAQEAASLSQAAPKGGTVRYAVWSSPKGVFLPALSNDNYDFLVFSLVYEGLLKMNPKQELEPCLAKSYEVSPDYKTVTFKLRDNVKWHDGEPFTAEDVRYTFEFMGDADYSGPYGSFVKPIKGAEAFKNKKTEHIEGIQIIDPHTISITTDEIYANALLSFGYSIRIMPKHIWEKIGAKLAGESVDTLRSPVGTGPFKLSKFVPDQYVEMTAYDDYWNKRPNIDKFIIQVTNQETAQAQMLNGEIDFMAISQMNPDDLNLYKSGNIQVQEIFGNSCQFMGMNNEMEVFKNKKVRQAFTYAINREGIVKDLLYGYGEVANSPYRSDFWAYPAGLNEYKYDQKKAVELFKEAGWEYNESENKMYRNGQPVKFVLKYPSGNRAREQAAVVIQQDLKNIGIQVELQIMEFSTALDLIKKGDYELCLMAMGGSIGDPDIRRFYGSDYKSPQGLNLARLDNDKLDELLEKGLNYIKVEDRKPIYNEAAMLLNEEMPVTYLYFWSEGRAINGKLKGVQCFSGTSYYDIENWYFEQ